MKNTTVNDVKDIIVVGGSKGGTGKSIVAMALIHHLLEQGEKPLLVEADTSNPDVWKCYRDQIESELVNLDEADGWIQFVNLCDSRRDRLVVVNTGARNNQGVTAHGATLNNTLSELGRRLVTLWVINRQRDSLELLKEYMDAIPDGVVHVLQNGYFGCEERFELYRGSKVRETVERAGGKSVLFPNLAARVTDDLYTRRLAISTALATLPLGNKAELRRWTSQVQKVMGVLAA